MSNARRLFRHGPLLIQVLSPSFLRTCTLEDIFPGRKSFQFQRSGTPDRHGPGTICSSLQVNLV